MSEVFDPQWVKCPGAGCGRHYPAHSEAGICIERYTVCLGCIIVHYLAPEARINEQADGVRYIVCPTCAMTGDPKCPTCHGTRTAAERLDGSALLDIRQPDP